MFFEHLISVIGDSGSMADYGITQDDLRTVAMRAENRNQDLNVEEVVEGLIQKQVLEQETFEKKAGGISRKDDDALHTSGTEENTKYNIVNLDILETIKERMD